MTKKIFVILFMMTVIIFVAGCSGSDPMRDYQEPKNGFSQLQSPENGEKIAVITTDFGVIKMRLFPEYAPKAVENFMTHAENGYYDGVTFHRVLEDFMIQGGDPTGRGDGGESIWGKPFSPEYSPQLHHIRGAIGMAQTRADKPTITSQFYIVQKNTMDALTKNWLTNMKESQDEIYKSSMGVTKKDAKGRYYLTKELFPIPFINAYLESSGAWHLDYVHTVFGQVFEGMDVVDAIAAVEVFTDEATKNDGKPSEDVIITSIKIETYNK